MTLAQLVAEAGMSAAVPRGARSGVLERPVSDVAYDSRRVRPGSVFVAIRGLRADGTAFAPQAEAQGALAIVAETAPAAVDALWLTVPDARAALAALSAAYFGHPSRALLVVGVTGTNGKTTTTYLIASILERAGLRAGRLGTVSYRIGGDEREAARTTPESRDVQELLSEMVQQQCRACVMEVSSHALAFKRADGIRFRAAVFTNLTRDHLDFHGDMETYFAAKQRLFEMLPDDGVAAINVDDPRGATLVRRVRRPVTYAIDRPADVQPTHQEFQLTGTVLEVRTPRGALRLRSRLIGRINVYNTLAAAATAVALDLPFSAIEQGIWDVEAVPGRLQIVSMPADEVTAIVDYAHTDDALRGLLETARQLAPGRIVTVFGCGGDRDRSKRPLMGAVAARFSDVVILTSDNPRSEDPDQIIEEIRRGIEPPSEALPRRVSAGRPAPPTPWLAIPDRREAIERAIRDAQPGDTVLIAGKGHERSQIIGDRRLPFDDVEVVREALGRRRARSSVT